MNVDLRFNKSTLEANAQEKKEVNYEVRIVLEMALIMSCLRSLTSKFDLHFSTVNEDSEQKKI